MVSDHWNLTIWLFWACVITYYCHLGSELLNDIFSPFLWVILFLNSPSFSFNRLQILHYYTNCPSQLVQWGVAEWCLNSKLTKSFAYRPKAQHILAKGQINREQLGRGLLPLCQRPNQTWQARRLCGRQWGHVQRSQMWLQYFGSRNCGIYRYATVGFGRWIRKCPANVVPIKPNKRETC